MYPVVVGMMVPFGVVDWLMLLLAFVPVLGLPVGQAKR